MTAVDDTETIWGALPRPGDVLHVGLAASVQFGEGRDIRFRVTQVPDWPTYAGWVWLTGYQLDEHGVAVERREIFVRRDGLVPVPDPPTPSGRCAR